MRVIVCGGRDFDDGGFVYDKLSELDNAEPITTIIHGHATGVDTYARIWGTNKGIPVFGFHADWEKHGNYAGGIRNGQMLRDGKPDVVVAFPGHEGTRNMKRQAIDAGVRIIEISRICRNHQLDYNCGCRQSNCCSRYTHGCGSINHKFFDPDMNGA